VKTVTTLLGLALAAATAAPSRAAAQDTDTPAAVVEALFRSMKSGDADAMRALLHPEARLITTGVQDGAPVARVVPVDRWLEGVAASTRELDERIRDVRTQQDQGLATVWARYDLFVDGALSHCGVDAFDLVRTADGWRIIGIADTRTTEGCAQG
jgi:ketosteroid isomerase-like protein